MAKGDMLAVIDWESREEGPMTRCPHCNAWDRTLDFTEGRDDLGPNRGKYTCEECGESFVIVEGHMSWVSF